MLCPVCAQGVCTQINHCVTTGEDEGIFAHLRDSALQDVIRRIDAAHDREAVGCVGCLNKCMHGAHTLLGYYSHRHCVMHWATQILQHFVARYVGVVCTSPLG